MPLPLLNFPLLVQEIIIQQIDLPEVLNAAVRFRVFRRLLQKIRYPLECMEWYISRNGEGNDSLGLTRWNEDDGPCVIIYQHVNVPFFNALEREYADGHNRLQTISTFILSLFKPRKLCLSIRRQLENLPNFYVWKYSKKFHRVDMAPYDGVIEISMEDLKFIFEEIQSDFHWIEVQCPAVYEGSCKCELLRITDHLEWVSIGNFSSSNCEIRTLALSQEEETPIKYSITDILDKWLTGSNMVLKNLSFSTRIMFDHEMNQFGRNETPAVLRDFNPIPSVLSRELLRKQCNDEDCKGPCWDIIRADGRRATIHDHSSAILLSDYFSLYIWDDEKLQEHKIPLNPQFLQQSESSSSFKQIHRSRMQAPLFKLPYTFQKKIIRQLDINQVFETSVAFDAFRALVQSVKYPVSDMQWNVLEEGCESDEVILYSHLEKKMSSLKIDSDTHPTFFGALERDQDGENKRMIAIATYVLDIFKPKFMSLNIQENLYNIQNLYVWNFSKKFCTVELGDLHTMDLSLADITFLFEQIQADSYTVTIRCPDVYEGSIKCDVLRTFTLLEWTTLTSLFSEKNEIEDILFFKDMGPNTIKDVVSEWIASKNMVLKQLMISATQDELDQIMREHGEVPTVLREFNATPSVLSREELQKQCAFYENGCENPCFDIIRNDGQKATIHIHRPDDTLFIFVWNDETIQKYT